MILCKDCKWWGDLASCGMDDNYADNQRTCLSHECLSKSSRGMDSHEAIGTGPDFGCVNGEDK